jgi:hypothetical protein
MLMVLGRGVWSRSQGGWGCEFPVQAGGTAAEPVDRAAQVLACPARGRTTVIFEPRGMAHPDAETPRVGRSVFASLARVREEHPAVSSEALGWGIEAPEPSPGGTYATLMHYEMTPGLVRLHEACERSGSRLSAAWPAFTACSALGATRLGGAGARCMVVLVPGFVALASLGSGRRAFRAWTEPMNDRDWKTLAALVAESAPGPGGIAVVAHGDPVKLCPAWAAMTDGGRVERVFGLDDLARAALGLRRGHPANLAEAFPAPRRLDTALVGFAAAALGAAAVLASGALAASARGRSEVAGANERIAALEGQLGLLEANRREMEALRGQVPAGPWVDGCRWADALRRLGSALPESLTLTELRLGPGNGFRLEGTVAPADFRAAEARSAMAASGFVVQSGGGWSYEPQAGTLEVSGTLEGPVQ